MHAGTPTDTRSDQHVVLQRWRRQRQRLQSNLQHTVCRALEDLSNRELEQQLDRLCRDLMDYLSLGHSGVYARYCPAQGELASRCPGTGSAAGQSERRRLQHDIWLHLGLTTDAALRFNRRCETTPLATLQAKLHAELGRLNKTLSLRFTLEEQLLELGPDACPPPAGMSKHRLQERIRD